MGISLAAVPKTDIAAKYLEEIEELVADNTLVDAFATLQDFTRDFLPELKNKVLILRGRFNEWRMDTTSGLTPRENINDIRRAILEIAGHIADEHRQAEATPPPEESRHRTGPAAPLQLVIDNARPQPAVEAPLHLPADADQVTLDALRKQYFQIRWKRDELIACDCQQVSKRYSRGEFVLQPTSVQLRAGQITAVVGMNASGKTTFLKLLTGELRPDKGQVLFPMLANGRRNWRRIKDSIAFIPQLPEKWVGRLRHNLNFVAAGHAQYGQDTRQLVEWNIQRYGLHRYDDATWDEISGGYKIRFELVRALISQPKLLILDEPLAYLDVIACQRFLSDLKTIATSLEQPIPVVVSSQHLHEIETVADQLILLDNGACKYSGPLEGIADQLPDRMLEITLEVPRDAVLAALDGAGLKTLERTMGGYILTIAKDADVGLILQRLYASFGGQFKSFRDISGSARGLMGAVNQ